VLNAVTPIGALIQLVCWALVILIFIRVMFSWIRPADPWRGPDFSNPLFRISYQLTEPVLRPVRNLLPMGPGLDFSPMIVSFLLFMVIGVASRL
jgi:YggT family protein